MATDSTNLPQDMNSADNDGSASFDAVQLAQANPAGAPVQIVIPTGAKLVRVPVTPGEIVELPFGADAHLLGKLGDNGNLAIKVGDVTVILEGYTAASGQQQVIIEGLDGQPIDIATVLAATDPNLDIQTAAGGDAAGAQGADNTGALFSEFGAGAGIGGFGAVGLLDQTELNYKLIDADQKLFVQEVAAPVEPDSVPVILKTEGGLVNEDDLGSRFEFSSEIHPAAITEDIINELIQEFCYPFQPLGNDPFDTKDAETDADDGVIGGDPQREPTFYDGKVTVDFGLDAPGSLRFPAGSAAQMEALGLSSNGFELHFQQVDDTHLQGYIFDGECYSLVMTVTITGSTDNPDGTTTFDVVFALDQNLDHPLPAGGALADETDLPIPVAFEAVDNNGSVTGGSVEFQVRDDIPFIGYPPSGEQIGDQIFDQLVSDKLGDNCVVLDEATVLAGAEGNGYGYPDAYGNFVFSYGADGPWDGDPNAEVPESPVTLELKVVDPDGNDTGIPVDVTSSLKSGGVAVTIDAPVHDPSGFTYIVGHLEGTTTEVFKITVSDTGTWTTEFSLPLDHPDAGETGSDDQLQFQLTVTIKDDDGDQAQTSLCIDLNDGGPAAQNDVGNVDESTTPISVPATGVLSNDSFGPDGPIAGGGVVGVEKGDTGTSDDDGSTVGTVVHGLFGDLTLNADGSYSYAMTGGEGNDVFTYTIKDADGDLSHATLTFTVDDQVLTPTVGVNLDGNELCITEDGSGSFIVTANTADNTDQLTQLTFTELKDLSDAGWIVAVAGTGGTTGSFDLTTGIFTITNVGAQTAAVQVTLTPPADSDRDVLNDALADITVTATAQDISTPALTSVSSVTTVIVHVDAVADPVTADIVVNDGIDANASFQAGEVGTVQVSATFGDTIDGSELHTVVLTVPSGFSVLDPAGGIYNPGPGTVTWFVGAGVTSFTPTVTVINLIPGNSPGAIFTVNVDAVEMLPISSGQDCDFTNNAAHAFDVASVIVANADAPRADLSLAGHDACIYEDSTTAAAENVLSVTAGALPGSHLTTIVLNNLNAAGWTYDFSGLAQAGFVVGPLVGGTITITAIGLQTSYAGTFAVQPPADSDIDYPGTIGLDATAASDIDPSVTAHTTDTQVIHVDAVADPVTAAISVTDSGDANISWQTGETGAVHVTATFGDASDGSETHMVILHIPAGFIVTNLPVSDGGVYDAGLGTVTWTVGGGVTSFTPTVTVQDVGAANGAQFSVDVHATENATAAGPNPGGDQECDNANNTQFDIDATTVVVANVTAPTADLFLASNDTCVLEDSTTASGDNVIFVQAIPQPGSHLTTIVISNLDPSWTYNFSGLSVPGFIVGPLVAGTITITSFTSGSYTGTFSVQPPANSDVDYPGTIGLNVTAASDIDPSVTATGNDTQAVHVDAVADPVTAAIEVKDGGDANTSWQTSESGTVKVTATFGDNADGSETHTVVLHIPTGFSVTDAAGGTYNAGAGTVTWTNITDASFIKTVAITDISATNSAVYGPFTVDVDAVEKATVAGPNGASGVECDNANNTQHDDDSATVVVANVTAPTAGLSLGGGDCILEDSLLANPENLVTVSATPTAGSHLTTIVLDGFQSGWTYNLAGLDTDGGGGAVTVSAIVAGKVTITLTGFAGAYSGTFQVQPPADSDVDHPSITAAATAASNIDPSVTATGNAALDIIVDAVADDVTALVTVSDANANGFFSVGEAGTAHVHATFGDALDGSETHSMALNIPAGFDLTDWNGATFTGTLPAGVTVDSVTGSSVLGWMVNFSVLVDPVNGVSAVDLDVNIECTAELGSGVKFSLDVAAQEVPTDLECDDGNNLDNNDAAAHSETSATSVRTLSGAIVTNSNVTKQQLLLMVVDENNPLAATSNIISLFLQGQQGSFVVDAGFDFNPNHSFAADIESVLGSRDGAGTHIQLTDYSLQLGGGISTGDMVGKGNVQLDDNDDGNVGPDRTGYTSEISAGTGALTQLLTESNDGTDKNNALSGSNSDVLLVYGADGTDTLSGGTGMDILRGGPGIDTLHGNDGNDVLVYGSGDHMFGDKGFDILRIDDGAIQLTKYEDGSLAGPVSNLLVTLHGQDIHDIESILITQEAIPDAAHGTTLALSAQDVLSFTDSTKDAEVGNTYDAHTLFIVGSSGDQLNLDSGFVSGGHTYDAVDTGTTNTSAAPGMTFEVYNIQDNGVTVGTLMVDKDVAVNVV